ncbi:MAG: SufD family Fe-S cluster assembly protein [Firmicutes bacterium]|nr:SufD family Fe-S cluster assembly protein [Bacillota bacterium]
MNKILIDKENNIEIKDNAVELDIKVKDLTLNIKGSVLINEICHKDNEELNLTINIEPKSSLIYNRFILHNKANNNITINQDNTSNVSFNYSIVATDKVELRINSTLSGNDNETSIKVASVTEQKGKVIITSTADVLPKIENNNLLESIKILLLNDEESICIPNLLVSSNEVEVNHAATISGIPQDYLFYLNSKGLSNEAATKLIKNGYLINNLDINKNIKDQIMELIGGE